MADSAIGRVDACGRFHGADCEHDRAIIQGGAILWCIECGAIQPWNNGPAGKWQRPSLAAAVKP